MRLGSTGEETNASDSRDPPTCSRYINRLRHQCIDNGGGVCAGSNPSLTAT
ncbi:MAG: hypothetical protein ACNYPD_04350 [Candidatus Halichondribacter symbioticus]